MENVGLKETASEKLCPSCKSVGIETPVEKYRDTLLDYCSYHYWRMKAEPDGMKLEDYVRGSQVHGFKTSLPSSDAIEKMERGR